MALLTEFPLWLVIFVILLGVGYACFLYFRNNNIVFEKVPRIVMACLRGVAMSLLAFQGDAQEFGYVFHFVMIFNSYSNRL